MTLTQKQLEQFIEEREIDDYEMIEDLLQKDHIDNDDVNPHRVIIKNKESGKFYAFYYDEWVGPSLEVEDIDEDLTEVFPKEKTITIYE